MGNSLSQMNADIELVLIRIVAVPVMYGKGWFKGMIQLI